MKIFDNNAPTPKYLVKHGKTHTVLVLLFSFVLAPILSIVMFATGDFNLVSTSISKIGWQQDMLPVVYLWGAYNLALFGYLLKLVLDTGKYSKPVKIFFCALTVFSCIILIVGISIPFISDEIPQHMLMRKIHNIFATIGFVMFVIVVIAQAITTLFRNRLQALISMAILAFLIITGIFAVQCVNSPERITFITAAAQMYIFSMLHVLLTCQYFLNKFLPYEKFDNNQNPSSTTEIESSNETDIEK